MVDVKVIDPGVRIDVVQMEWDVDDGREWKKYSIDDDHTPYDVYAFGNGKGVVYDGAHNHIIGINFKGEIVYHFNTAKMEQVI